MQMGPNQQADNVFHFNGRHKKVDALFLEVFNVVFIRRNIERLGSIFVNFRLCPARVDIMEKLCEDIKLDVLDVNFPGRRLFHVVLEHCGKYGTSSREYVDVRPQLVLLIFSFETEMNVAVALLDKQRRQVL